MTDTPGVVPELDVSDLAVSLQFYVDLIGFRELFRRPDEGFVYLRLDRADLMLQQTDGPGRRFAPRSSNYLTGGASVRRSPTPTSRKPTAASCVPAQAS